MMNVLLFIQTVTDRHGWVEKKARFSVRQSCVDQHTLDSVLERKRLTFLDLVLWHPRWIYSNAFSQRIDMEIDIRTQCTVQVVDELPLEYIVYW